VSAVENAIAVDPLLRDPTSFAVSSKKGVIQLSGKVHNASEKERVEVVIRTTLSTLNLKYDQLVNALQVL
jgi:osmotically-inducible protein OsmY